MLKPEASSGRTPQRKLNLKNRNLAGLQIFVLFLSSLSLSSAAPLALGNLIFNEVNSSTLQQLDPATGRLSTNAQALGFVGDSNGLGLSTNGDVLVMRQGGFNAEFIRISASSGQQTTLPASFMINTCYFMAPAPNAGLIVTADGFDQAHANYAHSIYVVDPTNGQPSRLATNAYLLIGVAVANDGTIYTCQNSAPQTYAILRFDPTNGSRTVVSSGGNLKFPKGMATEADGSVLVADWTSKAIIRINPNTGGQSIVSSGNNLSFPYDVTVAPNGDLFVAERLNNRVLKIDPATGVQTVLVTNVSFPASIKFIATASPLLAAQTSTNAITLAWTKAATNYHLEASENLGPSSSWSAVTNTPSDTTWQKTLSLSAVGLRQFFRLRQN